MRRRDALRSLCVVAERHHADGEIGDAGVAVAAQTREHGRLVARGHGVADVFGVAVLEQPNIVGGEVGVTQHFAGVRAGVVHLTVRAERDGNACDDAGSGRARRDSAASVMRGTT